MSASARMLADGLARQAEAVCRHYLSNGRRHGGYWIVGDVRNAAGGSTYVRLRPKGFDARDVGKWSEYVAPTVMLRNCARTLSCGRLAASRQHNISAREVA